MIDHVDTFRPHDVGLVKVDHEGRPGLPSHSGQRRRFPRGPEAQIYHSVGLHVVDVLVACLARERDVGVVRRTAHDSGDGGDAVVVLTCRPVAFGTCQPGGENSVGGRVGADSSVPLLAGR